MAVENPSLLETTQSHQLEVYMFTMLPVILIYFGVNHLDGCFLFSYWMRDVTHLR